MVRIHARLALLIISLADCSFVPFLSQCHLLNSHTSRLASTNEKKSGSALCCVACMTELQMLVEYFFFELKFLDYEILVSLWKVRLLKRKQ